jgi:hypothetical protein
MIVFCVDKKLNKYVFYDEQTDAVKVFIKDVLETQLKDAEVRLSEIPESANDETLLEWARINYPQVNYGAEKQSLEAKVAECKSLLESI